MGSVRPEIETPYAEFPKHVTVGKNEDGTPITKIAANAAEEAALLAAAEAEKPAGPAEAAEATEPEK